jgi:hypothetical protein
VEKCRATPLVRNDAAGGGRWFEPSTAHLNPRSQVCIPWFSGSHAPGVSRVVARCSPRCSPLDLHSSATDSDQRRHALGLAVEFHRARANY